MNTNCLVPEGQCDEIETNADYDGPCFLATGALLTSFSSQKVSQMCFNKHRPISEQRPNRMLATEWQWMNLISLENPTSSSAVEEYTAERALHPQWRIETGDNSYHYHASPSNDQWTNSCAWTADGEETSWWSADFVGGESAVLRVFVFFMEGEQDRMEGAELYVDEELCDTVELANARPGTDAMQYVNLRCAKKAQSGSSVTIK